MIRKDGESLLVTGNGLAATTDMGLEDITYIGAGRGSDRTWTPYFG